jgi:multiple sugar transport system permease protein
MKKRPVYKIFLGVLIFIIIFWSAAPLLWIFISSISERTELYSKPPHWIPENPTFAAYEKVLVTGESFRGAGGIAATQLLRKGILNSLIVAIATTVLVMFFAPLLGYAFSRLKFRGSQLLFYVIIGIIALPAWPVLIGLFSVFSNLHLLDTKTGLILLSFTFRLPFETWFMKGYFESVPSEIEDAARIDGCTRIQTLFKVSIQMVMPGLIAVSIVSFLHTWNMFAAPLVLTYTLKSKPLTVTMTEFIGQYFVHWDLMSAATMISIIPPLIIVIFFQKYIIQGLSAGAIK